MGTKFREIVHTCHPGAEDEEEEAIVDTLMEASDHMAAGLNEWTIGAMLVLRSSERNLGKASDVRARRKHWLLSSFLQCGQSSHDEAICTNWLDARHHEVR